MALIGSDENKIQRAKTRVLLVLWGVTKLKESLSDADKKKNELPTKGELKLTRTGEKSADYDEIFEALEADGAITLTKYKTSKNVTLTQVGYGLLGDWLRSPDFKFEGTQIGARMGNFLVKWIASVPNAPVVAVSVPKISSYDEFKAVALETYKRLSYESNVSKLVPIYQIRRDIGDRLTRTQFNDWMLEMHRTDVLRLHGGGASQTTEDQTRDSIYSELLKTYYFNAELFN
ncbi:MAG: hypothetical protein WCP16_23730 [Pseudanabaena sp. ELA645]|jgi:hypothetical protein